MSTACCSGWLPSRVARCSWPSWNCSSLLNDWGGSFGGLDWQVAVWSSENLPPLALGATSATKSTAARPDDDDAHCAAAIAASVKPAVKPIVAFAAVQGSFADFVAKTIVGDRWTLRSWCARGVASSWADQMWAGFVVPPKTAPTNSTTKSNPLHLHLHPHRCHGLPSLTNCLQQLGSCQPQQAPQPPNDLHLAPQWLTDFASLPSKIPSGALASPKSGHKSRFPRARQGASANHGGVRSDGC